MPLLGKISRCLKYLKAGLVDSGKPSFVGRKNDDNYRYKVRTLEFMYEKVKNVKEHIDWSELVGRVPIQYADNCFAYAGATLVECAQKRKGLYKGPLCVQELTELDPWNNDDGGGCEYSLLRIYMKGLGLVCWGTGENYRAVIHGYESVYKEEDYAKVLSYQPISVMVDATDTFAAYTGLKGEVFCGDNKRFKANHDIVLVGIGKSDDGTLYYNAVNWAGDEWGDKGYIRIKRDCNANGIGELGATYPILLSELADWEDLNNPETIRRLYGINLLYSKTCETVLDDQWLWSSYSLTCNVYWDGVDLLDQITLQAGGIEVHDPILDLKFITTWEIDLLPRYLLVKIVRHSDDVLERNTKLHLRVNVPMELNISHLCSPKIPATSELQIYNLVAVLTHEGLTTDEDRYFARIQNDNGQWSHINYMSELPTGEIDVDFSTMAEGISQSAYILMYKQNGWVL